MASLTRDDNGVWSLERDEGDVPNEHFDLAFPRYLTAFDPAFARAEEACESEFVKALVRVGSSRDAGWDPYETTLRVIPAMRDLHGLIPEDEATTHFETARHLQLWVYGHIIEASEPYAILADMLHISGGGFFMPYRFPDKDLPAREGEIAPKRPWFFREKLPKLEELAAEPDLQAVLTPVYEIWDYDLRNAVFHADYSLFGGEVRTRGKVYDHDEIQQLVNRALAYHEALAVLVKEHRLGYTVPKALALHPDVGAPEERGVVMVRDGDGAIGFKHAYTREAIAAGAIAWSMARLFPDEVEAIRADPELAHFSARRD